MDQLVDRPCPEGVHPVGPVDRDPGQAVLELVAGVGQVHPSLLSLSQRPLGHRQTAADRQRLPGDVPRARRNAGQHRKAKIALTPFRLLSQPLDHKRSR